MTTVFWALENIFDKVLVTDHTKNPFITVVLVNFIGLVLLLPIALVFGLAIPKLDILLFYAMAILLWLLAIWLYFKAVQEGEASRVITAFNIIPFFVLFFAVFLLGETVSSAQFVGIVFLVSGAILVSLKKSKHSLVRKWILFVVISAALFGLDTIITKHLLLSVDWLSLLVWRSIITCGFFVIAMPFYYKTLKAVIKKPKTIALAVSSESSSLIGRGFLYIALSIESASLVYALTSVQPFFVLLMAIACTKLFPKFLKEEIDTEHIAIKIIAVVLAVVGAIMLA